VNRVLIAEVLSDSTEAYDRGELYEYVRGASCELVSVGVSLTVDDVYRDPLAGVA
jgi:hypothetical protein